MEWIKIVTITYLYEVRLIRDNKVIDPKWMKN